MLQFVLSLIGLVLSAIALTGIVAIWVYKDAKARSENAVAWALLSFFTIPIGLIIYLVVGRTKEREDSAPPKSRVVIPVIILIILISTSSGFLTHSILNGSLSGFASINSGSFIMSRNWLSNGHWSFSAGSANGMTRRSPSLTAEELDNFHVNSSNSGGEMELVVSQGDMIIVIDINDSFNDYIDMSDFSPGQIRIQLNFERASSVSTSIRWR
jgi:heme/copper-type cytochrome/quinol oxidase subunit 4